MMNQIFTISYKSPIGSLRIGSYKNKIVLCDWQYRKMRSAIDQRIKKYFNADYVEQETEVLQEAIRQLEEFFNRERTEFDLPLALAGTDFQQGVWRELLKVPFGQTCTYSQLSKQLKNSKAIRAVASANGANAHAIIIPCHRIIGKNGELVGYAGGLHAKKKLLEIESQTMQLQIFS